MADIKVMLDQSEKIDFDIVIESNATNLSKEDVSVRFVVVEKNMKLCFDTAKDGSTYTVSLPELKSILSSGEKECMLEVVCNDRFFVPWQSTILFEDAVKIKAEVKQETNKNKDIVIEVKKREKIEEKKEEKKVVKKKTVPKKVVKEDRVKIKENKRIDDELDSIFSMHKSLVGRKIRDVI